jgi:hypothetical protein
MLGEEVTGRLLAGLPDGTVGLRPEELRRLLVLGLQSDAVAIGELNDQAGEFKEGVGLDSGTDLLGDALDGREFWNQLELPSFEGRLWRRLRTTVTLVAWSPAITAISAAIATWRTFSPAGAGACVWTSPPGSTALAGTLSRSSSRSSWSLTTTFRTIGPIRTWSSVGSWAAGVASWPPLSASIPAASFEALRAVPLVELRREASRAIGGLGCPRGTEHVGEVDPQGGKIFRCFGVVAHGIRKLA